MAVNLSPVGGVAAQFFDNAGNVLTGGKLQTYLAGTTTPQPAYTTASGSVAWSNPIILDAAGRVSGSGEIWLTDGILYKFILRDSNDVLIATYDNINGINSNFVAFTNQQEIQTATAGQTVFNLATMQYSPGTNSLSVFVDGVNQYGPGAQYAYVETDSDTVTFVNGLHVGALVKFTTSQLNTSGAVNASQVSFTGFKGQTGNVQDLADNDGSDWVGFLPTGVSAVARSAQDKMRDVVTVKDFGAVGNGTTDDTAAIQAAINSGAAHVIVPTGTYRVDGTISLVTKCALRIDGTLSRLSTYTASTRPLILINNVQLAKVYGRGSLTTQNASIDGLVCIGPEDPTVAGNQTIDVQWCTVEGLSLSGAGLGTNNLGVIVQCTAAYGGTKVCYQNWIQNLEINTVGQGIYFGAQANANMVSNINMWNIGVHGINFAGNDGSPSTYPTSSITDNIVNGLFISNSFALTTSLQCVQASFNIFSDLHGEPGSGRLFSLDVNSESNYLTGIENHPQAGTNLGSNNTILTNVNITNNGPKFLASLPATLASATGDGTVVTINFSNEIFDTWPGGAYSAGTFTCPLNGKYRMSGCVYLTGLSAGHTTIIIQLITSNRTYNAYVEVVSTQNKTSNCIPWTILADMDLSDTAFVRVTVSGSTKTVNVFGDATTASHFAGELA
jgi:hypothetical protein